MSTTFKHETASEAQRRHAEIIRRLQRALQGKRLVILVGAGVTLDATSDEARKPLQRLTWKGLLRNGLDYLTHEGYVQPSNRRTKRAYESLDDDDAAPESLLDAANILRSQMRQNGQFSTWLESVFGTVHKSVRHPAILQALRYLHDQGATLLTTNYDDLLETACGIPRVGRRDRDQLLKFKRGDLDGVLHIHGSYHDPDEVVLDSTDYYAVTQSDEIQNVMKTYLEHNTILFVGCGSGLEDPNFSALLDWAHDRQENIPNRHCLLIRNGDVLDHLNHRLLVRLRYGAEYGDLALFLDEISGASQQPPSPTEGIGHSKPQSSRNFTDDERSCLHALYPSGIKYEDQKDQNPPRVPGTCLWALNHPIYLQWRENPSELLWISADAGCGKSVLARAIVDENLRDFKKNGGIVLYYFFKDTSEEQRSVSRAIASMLHQLFVSRPGLIRFALSKFLQRGKAMIDSISELWSIFEEAVTAPETGNVICLLDAFDECHEDQGRTLMTLLKTFLQRQKKAVQRAVVKILITSRPYLTIQASITPIQRSGLSITLNGSDESDHIKREIDHVIKHDVNEFITNGIISESVGVRLLESLLEMQQRTYLWLKLIWDLIRDRFPDTQTEAKRLIEDLPIGIMDAYEKLLMRCKDQAYTRKVLQVVLVAQEPLTLDELDVALHIDQTATRFSQIERTDSNRLRSTLPGKCGNIISVIGLKVYFIHQTVKEFLLSGSDRVPNERWIFPIDIDEAEQLMARKCVQFLELKEVDRNRFNIQNALVPYEERLLPERDTELALILANVPFLRYAATHWADHYKIISEKFPLPEFFLELRDDIKDRYGRSVGSSVQAASCGGHKDVVRMLLEKGADVNAEGGYYNTALQAASAGGYEDVVQMLLEKDADVNAEGGYYNTALQAASAEGYEDVVQMLLEKGADVNVEGGEYGTALQAASTEGHKDVVQMLLEKSAEVNAEGGYYNTALQAASAGGYEDVVQMLLEKGADVNAEGGDYNTALQAASAGGYEDVVQMLLEKGADVNAEGGYYNTALQAASAGGHKDVVQMLLEKGADVNAEGGKYNTALQAASIKGHLDVVQMLLKKGARINKPAGQNPNHCGSVIHDSS